MISANDWKIRIEDTILSIVDHCEAAFQLCLHRYPQHYKSVYRLAHLYATWSHKLVSSSTRVITSLTSSLRHSTWNGHVTYCMEHLSRRHGNNLLICRHLGCLQIGTKLIYLMESGESLLMILTGRDLHLKIRKIILMFFRPGSFSSHLYRCVALLCYVLRQLKDNKSLLHIHNLLNRIPDSGR